MVAKATKLFMFILYFTIMRSSSICMGIMSWGPTPGPEPHWAQKKPRSHGNLIISTDLQKWKFINGSIRWGDVVVEALSWDSECLRSVLGFAKKSCVSLAKGLNCSRPQFPIYKQGKIITLQLPLFGLYKLSEYRFYSPNTLGLSMYWSICEQLL